MEQDIIINYTEKDNEAAKNETGWVTDFAKFLDVMEEELGKGSVDIPERLAVLADKEKVAAPLGTDSATCHQWLRDELG